MTKLLTALVAVFLCLPAYAQPNPRTGAKAVLPWVAVDGDTIKRGKHRVRAFGYDTPELRGKCADEVRMAQEAKDWLTELMSPPHKFTVRYHKGHDEFGRAFADFYSDGRKIVPETFGTDGTTGKPRARPYSRSSGRQGWC